MHWFKKSSRILHLVIPDLLAAHAVVSPDLSLPALGKLLSRAQVEAWEYPHFHSSLFHLFGFPPSSPETLPIAALSRLLDENNKEADGKFYLRADPVYLQADRDRLVLFDAHNAETISMEEAAQIMCELNAFYAEEGLIFSAPHPKRWYVQLLEQPEITLYSVNDAVGHDIRNYMPTGAQQLRWRNRINEIQMLLHQSPVNAARVARHQLPINSLWFWGAGQLPTAVAPRWQQVWGNEEISQGLALHTQTPYLDLPKSIHDYLEKLPAGDYLSIITPNHLELLDREQWLISLEQNWFDPLLACLTQHKLDSIWIHTCQDKVFKITPNKLRCWWYKSKPWQLFLPAEKE
ncbi:MAG: hypothetical protein PHP00_14380 [Thiotrichaceae bacterium]|nr:hypothetical protein [Thiotrichaceae bacterium]